MTKKFSIQVENDKAIDPAIDNDRYDSIRVEICGKTAKLTALREKVAVAESSCEIGGATLDRKMTLFIGGLDGRITGR